MTLGLAGPSHQVSRISILVKEVLSTLLAVVRAAFPLAEGLHLSEAQGGRMSSYSEPKTESDFPGTGSFSV